MQVAPSELNASQRARPVSVRLWQLGVRARGSHRLRMPRPEAPGGAAGNPQLLASVRAATHSVLCDGPSWSEAAVNVAHAGAWNALEASQDSDLLQQFETYHAAATPGAAGSPLATTATEGPRVVFVESKEVTAESLTIKPSTFTTVHSMAAMNCVRTRACAACEAHPLLLALVPIGANNSSS